MLNFDTRGFREPGRFPCKTPEMDASDQTHSTVVTRVACPKLKRGRPLGSSEYPAMPSAPSIGGGAAPSQIRVQQCSGAVPKKSCWGRTPRKKARADGGGDVRERKVLPLGRRGRPDRNLGLGPPNGRVPDLARNGGADGVPF